MAFHLIQKGALAYSVSDALDGCVHCFSTRQGGVSEGCFSSLNLSVSRGDIRENVLQNYDILGEAAGFSKEQIVCSKQQHTDVIRAVTEENRGEGLLRETETVCDALITDCPGVALTVFTADCVPILLYDPVRRAIGAVHAGWRGTAQAIAAKTVERMEALYGCEPENIRAAIGPCIDVCCFETDEDVPFALLSSLSFDTFYGIWSHDMKKFHVDLKHCNIRWLQSVGVREIDISSECTCCTPERYWSHRRDGAQRGNMAAVIMLK